MPKINDSYIYIYISNIFPQANMIKINVPMCILMNIIGILITYTIAVIMLPPAAI